MDYVISDHWICLPEHHHLYTERVVALDDFFLCDQPHRDASNVANAPVLKNGFITFGSFNNLPKGLPTTIELWSKVLHTVTRFLKC